MSYLIGCMLLLFLTILASPAAAMMRPSTSGIQAIDPPLAIKKQTLKQKIALLIVRHQLRKQYRSHPRHIKYPGQLSFILGLASLLCLVFPLFVLAALPLAIIAICTGAHIWKTDPQNKKARKGIVLGIVTLALLVTAGALVIFLLSRGTH